MCVIINDASCLIDLRKGGLLAALCGLPYRFVVPLPVRKSEVIDFSKQQWRQLDDAGMITHDLTPDEVAQALALKERHPALSANDCFCFVTALAHPGILLTGDSLLRRIATDNGLRVHGVLWVIDELDATGCARSLLTQALKVWQGDDTVFLPQHQISTRLEYLAEAAARRGARTMNKATLRQPINADQCGH